MGMVQLTKRKENMGMLTNEQLRTGSVAATVTVREEEKYNLLHKGFLKLEAPLTVVLVCFAQEVGRYI